MKPAIALLGTLALAACQAATTDDAPTVSRSALLDAETAAEVLALGATQLDQSSFQTQLVDRPLIEVEGGWLWTIRSDGTAHSEAADGSWDTPSNWRFIDGQYCREVGCSDVYALSDVFRFSNPEAVGSLLNWAVTYR